MKTMISSGRRVRAKALAVLIIAALVAAVAGCGDPVTMYSLTIESTAGGEVAVPGEGTFSYSAGRVVNLVAVPDEGYRFVNWTGAVGTIDNIAAATTTIAIDGDYSITANFEQEATYTLNIKSTAGGEVTVPGEGTSDYIAGTVVNLEAEAVVGYRFVEWRGDVDTVGSVSAASTTITMEDNYSITANFEIKPMVAAGKFHTVGLKSDGTVVAVGRNDYGQCDVAGWTSIVQVAAGALHTVGLKSDGTATAVGDNTLGQRDVTGWSSIVQVAAGGSHTVGLKSDGSVVAVGWNDHGQRNVAGWTGIVQVAAGDHHTVGLKSDGTVVAVGWNEYGQCAVAGWTNIAQVAADGDHTVGVKSDGTVVAVGINNYGQCDVEDWTGIVQVAAGALHTVGLKSDGTVVAVGWNEHGQCNVAGWTGIVQVAAGGPHTVGLKSDGTVVAVGWNEYGQCDVEDWNLG